MTTAQPHAGSGSLRCFLALLPDAASCDGLQRCREPLERSPAGGMHGVRWVDTASLHLTLRFLGDTGVAQIEYLKHMLPTLARALPVIAARRCAIWPNRARPRLLVLEIDAPAVLIALASASEALARKTGFDPEPRAFTPHLTLARLRPGCLPAFPSLPARPLAFTSLALLASDLQPGGARYRSLASINLPAPAKT